MGVKISFVEREGGKRAASETEIHCRGLPQFFYKFPPSSKGMLSQPYNSLSVCMDCKLAKPLFTGSNAQFSKHVEMACSKLMVERVIRRSFTWGTWHQVKRPGSFGKPLQRDCCSKCLIIIRELGIPKSYHSGSRCQFHSVYRFHSPIDIHFKISVVFCAYILRFWKLHFNWANFPKTRLKALTV